MQDDEMMDRLLRETMAADAPQLSPSFDARVMRRVRPRRLSAGGRVVMAVYLVAAAAATAWAMRDLSVESIAAAFLVAVPVVAAATVYGRRLADAM
jgi:hypothetical protein